MPIVRVAMLEGRTDAQKEKLVEAITEAMHVHCGARREGVMVLIEDVAPANWGYGGKMVKPHPKHE